MEELEHGIQVGQKIVIEGRTYWVTEIGTDRIGFMLDPDDQPRPSARHDWPGFWRIFWCIVFAVVLLKLVF